MSIVEKAVARLKSLRPDVLVPATASSPRQLPAIERLQDETRAAEQPRPAVAPVHVDATALARLSLAPQGNDDRRRLANEMRRIKRPLLANVIRKTPGALGHAARIAVTSAVPGEGKTFTAINLALSLARERDFEVLLVDGDGPKADITRAFGLESHSGLMDVLADEHLQASDVIVPTDVPGLTVVPAGQPHPLAAELYASQRMTFVLEQLAQRNPRRLLLFDSPPLLVTPEAQALVAHMGQIVMVVAAGSTPRHTLDLALQSFSATQQVGLVLNKSRAPAAGNPYDSYYYGRQPADNET